MASEHGNERWRCLSDDSEPLPDDLFAYLPVALQCAVARGEVELDELLERITSAEGASLCPRCGCRPIRHERTGLCGVCLSHAIAEAHHEYEAEVVATRERTSARQQSKRAREAHGIEPDRALYHSIGYSAGYGVKRDGAATMSVAEGYTAAVERRLTEEVK